MWGENFYELYDLNRNSEVVTLKCAKNYTNYVRSLELNRDTTVL